MLFRLRCSKRKYQPHITAKNSLIRQTYLEILVLVTSNIKKISLGIVILILFTKQLCSKSLALIFILISFGVHNSWANEPISPIFPAKNLDQDKFDLGKALFKDTRLSLNNDTSCLTCHDLSMGGGDTLKIGSNVTTNSPTIFNTSKNFHVGWRGQFESLGHHLGGVLANPKVMGTNWPRTVTSLKADTSFTPQFRKVYQGEITQETIFDAILYFETNLIVPSKFDEYLLGNEQAISQNAKYGYEKFKDYGCISCHQGANVGGNLFQSLGVVAPYMGEDGKYRAKKLRVPSLRNVALTAPYLHDGSVDSLESMIRIMAQYQLGQTLTNTEIRQIKAFLESLNSQIEPAAYE